MPTKIEWASESWNPVTGCTPISEGCRNCYAKRMANRLRGRYGYPADDPFKVTFHPDRLNQPLRWEKPRRIFVVSMGDLFHEDVKYKWIDAIWSRIAKCPQHTFMVLTKRPERMAEFVSEIGIFNYDVLPNLWLGITCENQQAADKRMPIFLQIPAAVHFVSLEPLLGDIDLGIDIGQGVGDLAIDKLSWCIIGGESGPGARPMHPDWARSVRDQCQSAGVPFFFKQHGEWTGKAGWYLQKDMASCRSIIMDRDKNDKIGVSMGKVGKKKAGRILDGRTWDKYPDS